MNRFSSQLMDSVQWQNHSLVNNSSLDAGGVQQGRSMMDKVLAKQREDDWRQREEQLIRSRQHVSRLEDINPDKMSDLDLSLEDMGLSLLGEDIEFGRVAFATNGTISPRSQLLAELRADTPKNSLKKAEQQQDQAYLYAPPKSHGQLQHFAPEIRVSSQIRRNFVNQNNTCTLLNVLKPPNKPPSAKPKPKPKPKAKPAAAEENGIVNPVAVEHLNPRLRVMCVDKKAVGAMNQTQMLWHKYGEKTVRNRKAASGRPDTLLQRAYFKCFKRECSAKLTVDLNLDTRELVKTSSSGTHNHYFELASEE